MSERVKTLQEVSEEIDEEIGEFKKFNVDNGFYIANFRRTQKGIELKDGKITANLSFKGTKQPISFGYFKSKKGYNSKYKNNKEFANHYGEYIAYIILKQLGKKVCKVDIGEMDIKNQYSKKTVTAEGILSHYQLTQNEVLSQIGIIVEDYRLAHPKKYKEATERGKTNSDKNYTNIEIVLSALEDFFKRNGQKDKIPEIRKSFFDMCIFDIKFANRDRHDENFGLKINQDTNEASFYPLFDNEQILGMQENRADIIKYLSSEKEYEKFKNRELTSCIGIPGMTQKINPQELLNYLLENYYEETMESLNDIGRYTISDLEELLDRFPGLSNEHKEFAKKIFQERELEINNTVEAFNQRKNAKKEITGEVQTL